MQYNESLYNGDSYNLTQFSQLLVETTTLDDGTVTKSVNSLRVESQGMADALGGSATLQAFLEAVTIYQRASTPFGYNNGRYNDFMYNVRADEDEILLMPTKAVEDVMVLTDLALLFSLNQSLIESVGSTDATLVFSTSPTFDDFIFLSEFIRVEITNKALNENVRLADWISIERNPVNQEWYD